MDTGGGSLISVFGLFQYLQQAFFASIKVSVWKKELGETTFYQEARKRSQALPEQATFLLSIVSYCDLFWHYSMAMACEPMREEIDSAQIPTIFLVNKNAANQGMDFWTGEIYKRARVRPIPLCPPKHITSWYLCLRHRLRAQRIKAAP